VTQRAVAIPKLGGIVAELGWARLGQSFPRRVGFGPTRQCEDTHTACFPLKAATALFTERRYIVTTSLFSRTRNYTASALEEEL
jgi:hypothetical protein